MRSALLLVVLLGVSSLLYCASIEESCKLKTEKGVIDMNKAKIDSFYAASLYGSKYYVNFCGVAAQECSGQMSYPAIEKQDKNCFYLGSLEPSSINMKLLDSNDPEGGIRFVYGNGQLGTDMSHFTFTRRAVFTIRCDKNGKEDPKISDFRFVKSEMTSGTPNYLDNYFEATSPFACPRPEGSFCNVINPFCSLSLLIFFPLTIIGTIGYFVIGALVCKFALKKQKWEIIPNVHFWKMLPGLWKDGISLIIAGIRAIIEKIKTARGKYRQLK